MTSTADTSFESSGRKRDGATSAVLWLSALPALLLVDSMIGFRRGWECNSTPEKAFMAACGAMLLMTMFAWILPAGRRLFSRRRAVIHLAVLGVVFALLAMEGLLRLWVSPQVSLLVHTRTPNMRAVMQPIPELMPGVHGDSVVQYNSRGVRGQPIPEDRSVYRILCVGGSTTECIYLDDSETWPSRMMESLNARPAGVRTWVGNVGISGFSTLDHLRFVDKSPLASEMDCMVFLVGANDFLKQLSGRFREETFRPVWVKSACWSLVIRAWATIRLRQGRTELDAEDPKGKVYIQRRAVRREAELTSELPDLRDSIAGYQERLRAIIARCRALGVRCIFLTQPMVWKPGLSKNAEALLWLGGLADGRFVAQDKLNEGMEAYNRALMDVCREAGVECVDMSPVSGREELYYDDAHFNEAGALVVAKLAADQVLRGLPSPSSMPAAKAP